MIVDYHTHSLASDGALSPPELLSRARASGVTKFAITDHDTTAGYLSVKDSDDAKAVGLISGVELSCKWATASIHVVGLGFYPLAPEMQSMIKTLTAARRARASKIASRLEKAGIAGAFEGATALAGDSQIGRPHFAAWMVEVGAVSTVTEAFDKYLGTGKPGDVKMFWPALAEVVSGITASGGIAVLAHTLKYRLTGMKLRALLNDFKASGGRAIEILNGRQTDADSKRLLQLIESADLIPSVGSDFHREFEYGPRLGIDVARLPKGRYIWEALEATL